MPLLEVPRVWLSGEVIRWLCQPLGRLSTAGDLEDAEGSEVDEAAPILSVSVAPLDLRFPQPGSPLSSASSDSARADRALICCHAHFPTCERTSSRLCDLSASDNGFALMKWKATGRRRAVPPPSEDISPFVLFLSHHQQAPRVDRDRRQMAIVYSLFF